jgi:hypothetical protein
VSGRKSDVPVCQSLLELMTFGLLSGGRFARQSKSVRCERFGVSLAGCLQARVAMCSTFRRRSRK